MFTVKLTLVLTIVFDKFTIADGHCISRGKGTDAKVVTAEGLASGEQT